MNCDQFSRRDWLKKVRRIKLITSPSKLFDRKAGAGLNLEPDVVIYMGQAAQGMPQDPSMDQAIADGFASALAGDMAHGGSTPYKPMDAESLRRLNAPGTPMPESIKEMILKNLPKKA